MRSNWLARPWLWLVMALILEGTVLVAGQQDFVASDPLWYADIAHNVETGKVAVFTPEDHHPFVMRVGLTVPLAVFYRLFGVSTLVSNLPAILAGLACLLLVYLVAPTARAKAIGLGYALTCIALLHESILLNIDLPCAALLGFSVWFMQRRDEHRLWLLAAVVAAFGAFLVKETAVWCAPIWLWVTIADIRELGVRDAARRFAPTVIAGALLVAGYLIVCARVWGSPFARFDGIREVTFEHAWTLQGRPASAWVSRLTWEVPWLLRKMFRAALIPAVLAPWLIARRDRIWLVAAVTFLACYWFGSASTSAYTPLPITERMVLSVLPPLLVLATLATDAAIERWWPRRWFQVVAAVVALSLIVPAVATAVGLVRHPTPETDAFARWKQQLDANPVALVCADGRGPMIANFYLGFEVPPNVKLVPAADYPGMPRPSGMHVYALVNELRDHDAKLAAKIDGLKLPPVYRSTAVRIYDAGDGAALAEALR